MVELNNYRQLSPVLRSNPTFRNEAAKQRNYFTYLLYIVIGMGFIAVAMII